MFSHFFVKSDSVTPYGLFTPSHLLLFCFTALFIVLALIKNRHADEKKVLTATRWIAVILWVLEIAKIIFNFMTGNGDNPNTYVPLYFCSLPLYCLPLSALGRGKVKRIGDVFMVIGGMIGGAVYLICPNTTSASYPAIHFITFQSFALHGIMVYLSLWYMITGYCRPVISDIKYYSAVVVILCIVAAIANHFLGSNLMFLANHLPGSLTEVAYVICPPLYPYIMTFAHAVPPFFVIYGIMKMVLHFSKKKGK